MSLEEKIDMIVSKLSMFEEIHQSLSRIEKSLKIVPDKEITITDSQTSLEDYTRYAKEDLNLEEITIQNQRSAIQGFLQHSKGQIGRDSVKAYLDTNPSPTWKTNQLKALRRYVRDFLKLGNWIQEFQFERSSYKIQKAYPTNEQLTEFFNLLPYHTQFVFLMLFNSGLRIGEVLSLQVKDIDFETNMINASDIHKGETKSSWISFITQQTADDLLEYLSEEDKLEDSDNMVFSFSARSVQQDFKNASEQLGLDVNPKLLRKVFADRCGKAGIDKKYTDAFCGRTPKTVLQRHYTDYSPEALREQYDKLEPFLTL
jgi:integrase